MQYGNSNNISPHQRIALVDCNNFYVSCERVFRPDWKNRPVGVLSNNDGCIISRSNELKAAGIPMGAPYFKYRQQLNEMQAVILSSNYALYGDMSARVMQTLAQFTPYMEVYSIDEAWLDLTGIASDALESYAGNILTTAIQHTGIPVSVGIGSTKVRAKLANRWCKKQSIIGSVFDLEAHAHQEELLQQTKVEDIWGIGRKLAARLYQDGIITAAQLRDASPDAIRRRYNVVMQRIVLELRGIACLQEEDVAPKKQIIVSRSFGRRVTALEELEEAVAVYISRAAEKLRLQDSACGMLHVSLRTGRHNPQDPYYSTGKSVQFAVATSDTRRLGKAAKNIIQTLYRSGYRYAKAGVMLYDIVPAVGVQTNLFDKVDDLRSQQLMHTIDALNKRYGRNTLFLASTNTHHGWAMQRNNISPSYTTEWNGLKAINR